MKAQRLLRLLVITHLFELPKTMMYVWLL